MGFNSGFKGLTR